MNYSRQLQIWAGLLMAPMLPLLAGSRTPAARKHTVRSAPARITPYLMANSQREIALARSAAPPALSLHATVMVLGRDGYVTAVKGSDGFVCLDVRSWDHGTTAKTTAFWNPKFRAPYCYNAAAARTVLPRYLMRTKWVLAGASEGEIGAREKAARSAHRFPEPAAGSVIYMMSKQARWIGNQPGPWRPHLMFYFPYAKAPHLGANRSGVPVYSGVNEHLAVRFVLVPAWSDGSPAPSFR